MAKLLKNKILLIVACVVWVAVICGLVAGNVVCGLNFNVITQYMCGFGLDEDSAEAVGAREYGQNFAIEVEEEGAVLLKNEKNADGKAVLPLEENSNVNVFGWAGCDSGFIVQGTGSGTGSRNNLTTFLGGLREAGFNVNEQLASDYESLGYERVKGGNYVIEAYTDELYKEYYGVVEAPEDFLNEDRINQAKEFSDTAIVVLGRLMGEGNDYSHKQYIKNGENDESRKLLSISAVEEAMIKKVTENFENVVLVLNVANPMELGFVEEYDIDSVVWMGYPGTRGTVGIGNLLCGKENFSGRLADTYAYDLSTAASYANAGREGVGSYTDISSDTSLGTRANKYSDYAEDIYIGYKWYETADAEGFWDTTYAKEKWGIENGYEDVVQYPFGYGLSYSEFEWTITGCNYEDGASLDQNGTIEITVTVENTGDVAGRDVVELYSEAPYTDGGIEKSSIVLGAFAKTETIEPGEIKQVKLELPVERMASYDCYDRNNNGFMGYELEGGTYTVSLRTDVHTPAVTGNADGRNSYSFTVPDSGYKYETDSTTGTKVTNQFTNYTNTVSGATSTINEPVAGNAHSIDGNDEEVKIEYMTRGDFVSSFPEEKNDRVAGDKLIDDAHYVTVDPEDDPADEFPTFDSSATSWQITDLLGVEYDDPMWDELISQLSLSTCGDLIVRGGFGTIAIDEIGMPKTVAADGPAGFNNSVTGQGDLKAVNYPCATVIASTWSFMTAYEVGVAKGTEGAALGISGWYGPGANLHRSPLGGRNFEYYSEDPLLSGIICAYEVMGAKSKGLTAYIKHITVNETESGRNGAYKWLTEQNLRENILKPFEYAVKVGGSNAMMSSVDRVGSTRASGSYAMLTQVLRNEWGFRGSVITDYYQNAGASRATDTVHDVDECVRAGNSQILYTDGGIGWFNDSSSATAQQAIFKSAKDILYTYVDTLNFSMTSQGLEIDDITLTSNEVFPWWVFLLVGIDVIGVGLVSLWVVLAVRGYIIAKKAPNANPAN